MVVLVDFKLFWRKNRHIVYKEIDYIRSKLTISENPVAIISLLSIAIIVHRLKTEATLPLKLILEGSVQKVQLLLFFVLWLIY